ncbi:centrosomal protein of 78 kDa [Gadus morhua]|uniref:Centrosomal protein 78 n=1 Tax=Gadus morhua TaxID=8049 RepID=A0A8C5ATP5_GADMO|nr:centrosomal protein of 78 kDa [Gadus morhua]
MVQDGAHIRRRGAQDFASYYSYACARQDTLPLPAVMTNLLKGKLDFNGDRVRLTDWAPILSSISINKHLYHIAISSTYQVGLGAGDTDRRYYKSSNRKKIPPIRSKDMTFKLCKALQECVTASPNLKSLHINGLPLRERDLNSLTKGLSKSVSLEQLSLANCPISDEGLEVICQSVKYTTCIKAVDFTGCNLTWRGAEHMANIIKHQGLWRHSTAWAESLRYRRPEFGGMGGLRRITLNCNSLIGDRGAAALAHELGEDLWVKAVDLQKCGLSDQGAQCLLEALKTNSTLNVLDIRSNPLIDKVLIKATIEKVLKNSDGQASEYYWIKPPVPKESQKAPGAKRRGPANAAKRKATFRIATRGGASAGRWSPVVSQQQLHRSRPSCVPWRTAARAERQRCLSTGIALAEHGFQGAATLKVTIDSSEEEEEEEEEEVVVVKLKKSPSPVDLHDRVTKQQYQRVQMELEQCRRSLAEERRARLRAESQLREHELEASRLRSLNHSLSEALAEGARSGPAALAASRALEDEAVLQSIESSFTKFHAFLDLLKDAGLGQLASVAGIDQSDFGLLSRPQLSSTMGQPLEEDLSVSKGGLKRAVSLGAKIDVAVPLEAYPLTIPSGEQAPAFPPGPPSAPREFLSGSRLSQASGPAIDPSVDLEGRGEEPDQFSKPDTQQDSGSEGSVLSRKSYSRSSRDNKASRSANHHSNGNSHQSNSHSHPSNGSHRYSLNYSSFHSDGSLHSRANGDRSQRSSLSDITSEKLESEGSFRGSKGNGAGRRVLAGISGRGLLPGRSSPRLGSGDQIKSLGVLSGGSEDGSF